MATIVQARKLNKVYDLGDERIFALSDVSLEIYTAEMVAILGDKGSGKSTLLHTLGLLQRPDSGEVSIHGMDVSGLKDEEVAEVLANKVGFLFQAFNLLPDETAQSNVEVALEGRDLAATDMANMAREALQTVGLGDRQDSSPGQLSAGARLCLAVARALVHRPEVIFADEPTRGLDADSTLEVMGLFQRLNNEGMTVMIATSDTEVTSYCSRVIRISEGKIVDGGTAPGERQLVIPSGMAHSVTNASEITEEVVCPRCSSGNPLRLENCRECRFPLHLTEEEAGYIRRRLSGIGGGWTGVESLSDEADVPGPGRALIEELRQVPFFSELGSRSMLTLLPAMERRRFPKGSVIVKQGDEGDSFYVIRSGSVQVVLHRQGRPEIPIATLGANEGFGEMALLADQPRSATVLAVDDVEAWQLPKRTFERLLSENLSLGLHFSRIMTRRLSMLQQKMIL